MNNFNEIVGQKKISVFRNIFLHKTHAAKMTFKTNSKSKKYTAVLKDNTAKAIQKLNLL